MSMNISRVGVELWDGAESMGYELTSDLMSVTIADLGAHLASVVLRLEDSEQLEVTVGYPPGERTGYFGASIGRYANRIAEGRFTLDDVDYELDVNQSPNHLHGGSECFRDYAWSADAETEGDTGRVVLKHKSKDGDMGYPGKVQATAIFELTGNQLTIDYRAKTNAPTPVNLTNHAYWNLAGSGALDGHDLTVAASTYVEVDDTKIPLAGPPASVEGTRYDFRDPQAMATIVDDGGYDRCFVLDTAAAPHATLSHVSGRRIELTTNQIGLQVHTAQHSGGDVPAVPFEPQCLPDTPNRPDFGDATVRPGDDYLNSTTLTFHDG